MAGIHAKHFIHDVILDRDKIASFDEYPFSLPAVRGLEELPLHPNVTFLVGENGSGKSTLLEAVAVAFGLNPEGGNKNYNFETRTSHSPLCDYLRLRRGHTRPKNCFFLRAETFYNLASYTEEIKVDFSFGDRRLHEQSHGESFFALFLERFRGRGLYLLDEPEAALSPMRQMAFLRILDDLVNDGSQLIIATHSPIILAYPNAWIYEFTEKGPQRVSYQETEHFRVYRDFLNRHELMVKLMLKEDAAGD